MTGPTPRPPDGSAAEGAIELVNQRLAQRRMPPIRIEKLDASLAVEDVMEMVQAGYLVFTLEGS
ncbi:hypothetical protein ACLBPJ_30055, partial [Klebsiella pneumoniae]